MNKKLAYLRNFLPLIGLTLFAYIIWRAGIHNILNVLIKMNPLYLFLAFIIFIPRIFISTYKWQMIAKKQGIDIDLLYMVKINLIGLFYGTITPLWIGDAIRIFYLREKSKKSMGKCTSNFVIDQLIEFFSLFILALIGSILLINAFPKLFTTLFAIFVTILTVVILLKNGKIGKKFFSLVYGFILPQKFRNKMEDYSNEFYKDMPSLKFLMVPLLIEIFSYSLFFTQIYIVAIALHIYAPLTAFLFIYPIASLIGQIPVTISGFGTRESALIKLFSIYEINASKIVALSLTSYVITFLIPALIGMYYSFRIKLKLE